VTRIVAPGSEKRPLMDVWSAASVTLIGIDCRSFREAPLTGRVVGCRLWSLPVAILGFDSACFMIGGERRGQGDLAPVFSCKLYSRELFVVRRPARAPIL
jgi:hypothetical protein